MHITRNFKFILISLLIIMNGILVSQIQTPHFNDFFNKKKKEAPKIVVKDEIKEKVKNCDNYEGLFNIYQDKKTGKAYIEIDTSHLKKEYIYFSYFENGVGDVWANRGRYRGSKIIKFDKYYNSIDVNVENTKYYFDENNALSKASQANINSPIVVSENIIAKSPCKTKFLISADNIFLTESLQQVKYIYPGYRGFKLGNLSKKTRYKHFKNYPENTDVVVNYVYESRYPSSYGSDAVTDSRVVSLFVQHSIVEMPDDKYIPRYDDTRVGYFTTQSNDMTTLDRVNYRDFINRWRLEKKNPEEEISEPVKPIIYWIENTTPLEFRQIIKEGVETWNIAFEKAGFKNAIQVNIQPDTAEWDAGDIRYNVLRWTSSPSPPWGGYGPSFVNPRTGEILGADIMLEWTYVTGRVYQDELFNSSDRSNHLCDAAIYQNIENNLGVNYIKTSGLSEAMEKELVKQSLYRLVLHEVGHTLGLNHNFKGSLLLSNEELNNKDLVNEKGVCSSVMEYPAINITRDTADQGLFFDIKPGVYDIWAIEFGYTTDTILDDILSRSTEKELAFANDAFDMRSPGKGTDPNAMIYDLSSDQINHSLDKINMIENIMINLKDRYTKDNDTYEELYRSYRSLLYSYYQCLNVVSRQIGGVMVDLSHIDQNSDEKPFVPVEIKKQKEALEMISKYGFSNRIVLGSEIFPYLQKQRRGFSISNDPEVMQRVLSYESRLLDHLLHPKVLFRMTNSTYYGNIYSVPDYMIDLRKSVFSFDMNTNVTAVRQNLQIEYVNRLLSIVNGRYDNISKSAAYYNLNWLKNNLNSSNSDFETNQHRKYIKHLVTQGLDK